MNTTLLRRDVFRDALKSAAYDYCLLSVEFKQKPRKDNPELALQAVMEVFTKYFPKELPTATAEALAKSVLEFTAIPYRAAEREGVVIQAWGIYNETFREQTPW